MKKTFVLVCACFRNMHMEQSIITSQAEEIVRQGIMFIQQQKMK